MALFSLQLLDSDLALARGDAAGGAEIVERAPGVAVLEDDRVLCGQDALARMRLRPLFAHTQHWRELATSALPRPTRAAGTPADLAFAQLEALLAGHKAGIDGLLLAVPAGYTREQLGLLLGICNETGLEVRGLVDAGVAASALDPAPPRVLHLELELHQAVLTVLEQPGTADTGLKRVRYERAPRQGWLALQQVWAQLVAETFIRKTRFDPLHEAASEQRLFDRIPAWLEDLKHHETLTVDMPVGPDTLSVEVPREDFIGAAQPFYAELLKLVQGARAAGERVELRLSHLYADLPGFAERLATLRDCAVRVLPPGAAALGALRHAAAIERPSDSLTLVWQLPVERAPDAAATGEEAQTPPHLRPTHVLFGGRAWRIAEQPLTVGWAPGAARALTLPAAAPGVSRSHCTLVRRNGAVFVEDHSTYGSFVNEERVRGRTALTVGDRLRLGSPGFTLDLIQLVNDDGTPQD